MSELEQLRVALCAAASVMLWSGVGMVRFLDGDHDAYAAVLWITAVLAGVTVLNALSAIERLPVPA